MIRERLVLQDLPAQQVLVVVPGTEENMGHLVLLAFLALLDKMENLVGKEKKALPVSEVNQAPPGRQVHLEAPVPRVLLVHKESKENAVVQVFQVRLVFLVLVAYLVLLVTMATLDHQGLQARQAKMGLLVPLDRLALLEAPEVQVQKESLAHLVKEARQVHVENRVHLVLQEL